jgi:hypothetical protein
MDGKFCLLVESNPKDQELFFDVLHRISSKVGCYAVENKEQALIELVDNKLKPNWIVINLCHAQINNLALIETLKRTASFQGINVIVLIEQFADGLPEILKNLDVDKIYLKFAHGSLVKLVEDMLHPSAPFRSIL